MNPVIPSVICGHCRDNPCRCSGHKHVPYAVANLKVTEKPELYNGVIKELDGGRKVGVWLVAGEDGLAFKFSHPTLDGKMSHLFFGLKPDACLSLFDALSIQIQKLPPP